MDKEFVPYQPSLDMKELGFDEPCFSYYKNDQLSEILEEVINSKMRNVNNEIDDYISAPTFSQAFRWFREKYKIFPYTYTGNGNLFHYCMFIKERDNQYHSNDLYLSNEEAELECLKKLIEICRELK
jgi:hypothetical protein